MEGHYGASGEDRRKTQMKRNRRLGVVTDLEGEVGINIGVGLGKVG